MADKEGADELCEDPQHHLVLLANDDELDLFLTFISTNTYKIVGTIKLDGTDSNAQKIKATNGIEQCQWSPRLLSVPSNLIVPTTCRCLVEMKVRNKSNSSSFAKRTR